MVTAAVIGVLAGAAILGLVLCWNWWTGRHQPVVRGIHVLLGLASFETVIAALLSTEEAEREALRDGAHITIALLMLAAGGGLAGPLLAKRAPARRTAILVAHAGVGMAGVSAGVLWAVRL